MRVRVEQTWKDGVPRDSRERYLSYEVAEGHLTLEGLAQGERFAALMKGDRFSKTREELLPRLWSPQLVSIQGNRLVLRGVQRNSGRLCHQEWSCEVLRQEW